MMAACCSCHKVPTWHPEASQRLHWWVGGVDMSKQSPRSSCKSRDQCQSHTLWAQARIMNQTSTASWCAKIKMHVQAKSGTLHLVTHCMFTHTTSNHHHYTQNSPSPLTCQAKYEPLGSIWYSCGPLSSYPASSRDTPNGRTPPDSAATAATCMQVVHGHPATVHNLSTPAERTHDQHICSLVDCRCTMLPRTLHIPA